MRRPRIRSMIWAATSRRISLHATRPASTTSTPTRFLFHADRPRLLARRRHDETVLQCAYGSDLLCAGVQPGQHRWPIYAVRQPAAGEVRACRPRPLGPYHRFDRLPGVIVSGGEVHHSVLSPNVRIHSWSQVVDSILFDGVVINRRARSTRRFDKNVVLTENSDRWHDTEHDLAVASPSRRASPGCRRLSRSRRPTCAVITKGAFPVRKKPSSCSGFFTSWRFTARQPQPSVFRQIVEARGRRAGHGLPARSCPSSNEVCQVQSMREFFDETGEGAGAFVG